MNANFRRDYSYRATEDLLGVEEGEFLRYLKYDRSTKSYLFLTGKYSNKEEKLIVVPRNKAQKAYTRFKKLECIDYYPTNDYQGDFGKLITKTSQLEKGRAYRLTVHVLIGFRIDSTQDLRYLGDNCFEAINNTSYKQLSDDSWFNNGDVTARLVG